MAAGSLTCSQKRLVFWMKLPYAASYDLNVWIFSPYRHDLGVWLSTGGMDFWMDLLTTYAHQSELQVITALSLISTLYKSLQHRLNLFPACRVFISLSLATASNSGDSSASRVQVILSQPPVQNSCQLSTQLRRHLFWVSLAELNLTACPSPLPYNRFARLSRTHRLQH
jgi:hypothetical protein